MNTTQLKTRIIEANETYRAGKPIMSDIEFDNLLEEFEKISSKDEYEAFRNTLNEGFIDNGRMKIKHRFICGSLDKTKAEEPENVLKFINKHIRNKLNVSAKIDGLSGIAKYVDGRLVGFATRGDGSSGENIFDKAKYVKHLPQTISINKETYVRGELVILTNDIDNYEGATARNIVAGVINRIEWDRKDVENISFIAYTIQGDEYSKHDQFKILEENKFKTAWHEEYDKDVYSDESICDKLIEIASQEFEMECDGLVLSDSEYRNEEKYRPDAQVAFKLNAQTATTKLINVVFEGPSKDGTFVGVGLIDPVVLGDATISRVTLHNLDFIAEKGLKYGSTVEILRSGDVIPKLVRVVENDEHCRDIVLPVECSCCGSKLERDGVNLRCMNYDCPDQVNHRIVHFIKKLGVKSASNATLKNFNINSFDDLIRFSPNKKYKSEVKLYDELSKKVFTKTKKEILCAMNFKGLSEVLLDKIIDFYSLEEIEKYIDVEDNSIDADGLRMFTQSKGLPLGIGDITLNKFIEGLLDPFLTTYKITSDKRWSPSEIKSNDSKIIGSICVTGSLKFGSRNKFLEFAREHGYESKSGVSKGLTYLVNNDIESNSSKNKKAKDLGIKIISEDDFMKLLNIDNVQNDIFEL